MPPAYSATNIKHSSQCIQFSSRTFAGNYSRSDDHLPRDSKNTHGGIAAGVQLQRNRKEVLNFLFTLFTVVDTHLTQCAAYIFRYILGEKDEQVNSNRTNHFFVRFLLYLPAFNRRLVFERTGISSSKNRLNQTRCPL